MVRSLIALLALCIQISAPLKAEDLKEVERSLSAQYNRKVLILRNSCRGRHLEYTSEGALLKHQEPGPWTLYGSIRVDQVHVNQVQLRIEGTRMFLAYNKKEKKFAEMSGGDVYIVVDLYPSSASLDSIMNSLKKIFLRPGENLADIEPPYWRNFLLSYEPGNGAVEEPTVLDGQTVYKVEVGKVTAPKEIFYPAPDYTQEARDVHYSGSLTLSLVVNTQGQAEDISILEPSGMGLDDNAVAKVRTWKFKPGMRGGLPVPVRVKLDVSFSLGRI